MSADEVSTVMVTFTTDAANGGLAAKVAEWVERMTEEGGLDMEPGRYYDLTVAVAGPDGAPVWGSVFDGRANNDAEGGLYAKCGGCHLFVDEIDGYMEHFHRGDEADEELISTHDATWSGQVHTLAWWKQNGPAEMRARFTD